MDRRRHNIEETHAWMRRRSVAGPPKRILLAEDDLAMRELLVEALDAEGFEVAESPNGMSVLARLTLDEPERFDLIISDIRMPGVTGLEILEGLRDREGIPPMVLITAFGDAETHDEANRLGAAAVFDKPFDIRDLVLTVHRILSIDRPDTTP